MRPQMPHEMGRKGTRPISVKRQIAVLQSEMQRASRSLIRFQRTHRLLEQQVQKARAGGGSQERLRKVLDDMNGLSENIRTLDAENTLRVMRIQELGGDVRIRRTR